MTNNSLTILTNRFFALFLKSPIQMGWLSIINSVTNISRLGTFNRSPLLTQKSKFHSQPGPGALLVLQNILFSLLTPGCRWKMYAVASSDTIQCFTYSIQNINHTARLPLLPSSPSPLPPSRNHNMDL
jgi:hypothetical protein